VLFIGGLRGRGKQLLQLRLGVQDGQGRPHVALADGHAVQVLPLGEVPREPPLAARAGRLDDQLVGPLDVPPNAPFAQRLSALGDGPGPLAGGLFFCHVLPHFHAAGALQADQVDFLNPLSHRRLGGLHGSGAMAEIQVA
jgi:hypothetical protein